MQSYARVGSSVCVRVVVVIRILVRRRVSVLLFEGVVAVHLHHIALTNSSLITRFSVATNALKPPKGCVWIRVIASVNARVLVSAREYV